MKKLSKELLRSYHIFILLFIFSFFGFSISIFTHYRILAKKNLDTVSKFLDYEFNELRKQNTLLKKEDLANTIFEEMPKIENVFVLVNIENDLYSSIPKEKYPNYLESVTKKRKGIKFVNFFDYAYENTAYNIEPYEKIYIKIFKNMSHDKIQYYKILLFLLVLLIMLLIVARIIYKRFYTAILSSIRDIQIRTNAINLDSIDKLDTLALKNDSKFIEFGVIMESYNNMVKRLKNQLQLQIDFVNNTSHELKTPIFVIGGYADMLLRWGKNDSKILDESLISIKSEAENMRSLIERLLILAKGNNITPNIEKFDLDTVITSIINDLTVIYPNQEFKYKHNKIFFHSDKTLVLVLLKNLIENSVKYGKNNPVIINTFLDNNVCIEIIDHGIGIKKENMPYIFDKFFKEDKSRNRASNSHGLGLSIVKKISELLNGNIQIDSKENIGTTAKITLPAVIEITDKVN